MDLIVGDDGRARPSWAVSSPMYLEYYDTEWGVPVRDERGLFERLSLEVFQCGLSWSTILNKRERFREAVDDLLSALRGGANSFDAYDREVAQDLIDRRITSPRHLGVQGGSNGGLLAGNMLTQYPELFGAVVVQVPLLDMKRYNKLLAGASWMAEYGDPD